MRYITDLTVLEGKNAEPRSGWTKIDKDLNAGAGGAYLYFAYEEGDNPNEALRHIMFLDRDEPVPHTFTKIDVDLNKDAHGKYIYAAFTREPKFQESPPLSRSPLIALDVLVTDTPDQVSDGPWIRIAQDLNEGAKGQYVFLRYQVPRDPHPIFVGPG